MVKRDGYFGRIARKLSESVSDDINRLLHQYLSGNPNPGKGVDAVGHGTNIFYLRGENGGRVFLRWNGDILEILAYADKTTQGGLAEAEVIKRLIALYGG